jgi:hypothetical protein
MGYGHDVFRYHCGCENHCTYDDACGMGPIKGTTKQWWIWCDSHREAAEDLEKAIFNLEDGIRNLRAELDRLKTEARKSGIIY